MKKISLNVFMLLIIIFQITAQDIERVNGIISYLDFNSKTISDYSEIKGSPYLTDDFVMSKVFFKNDSIMKIALRYNIYDKSMELKLNNSAYSISNPHVIKKIEMNDNIFIYYYNKNDINYNSYYELLVSGKNYLIAKKDIVFRDANPPKYGILEPEPKKFINRKDIYYVVKDSSLPIIIKNNKSMKEIFSDKKEQIEKFIKKEKISYKKRNDLIQLVKYYNSL